MPATRTVVDPLPEATVMASPGATPPAARAVESLIQTPGPPARRRTSRCATPPVRVTGWTVGAPDGHADPLATTHTGFPTMEVVIAPSPSTAPADRRNCPFR